MSEPAKSQVKFGETRHEYFIGSAQRKANGEVDHYAHSRRVFSTLSLARQHIEGILSSYKERDVPIPADEFVPIEVATTVHPVLVESK